jgi:hypothetical protein
MGGFLKKTITTVKSLFFYIKKIFISERLGEITILLLFFTVALNLLHYEMK